MDFINQIALFFTNMTVPVAVCLVVGIIFICVEIFQPGFGAFGVIGALLVFAGAVLRAVYSGAGDDPLAQVFILLFFVAIIVLIAYIIMIRMSKMSWLRRSPFIEESTAVGVDISDGTPDYSELNNKVGYAATDLRPVGKAMIDGNVYDVLAEGFYIKKGDGIKVIAIEGAKVLVKRAE